MQVVIDLPDKIGKKINKKISSKQIKKAVVAILKNEASLQNDTLWDIPKLAGEINDNLISGNHDEYLTQFLVNKKTNI